MKNRAYRPHFYRTIITVTAIISLLCVFSGCATTDGDDKTNSSGGKTVAPATGGKITDWYNKSNKDNPEKTASPEWLGTLVYGDGSKFLSAKNKSNNSQRFIVIAAGEAADLETAQLNATNDLQRAMATEMYIDFSIAMKDFTQEQRKVLFEACMKVDESVKTTKEGSFWRKYETTKSGKTTTSYTAYEFYSISQEEFNRQRDLFLTDIFQLGLFDRLTLSQMITQYDNFTNVIEKTSISDLAASKKDAWKRTLEDISSKTITSTQKSGINPLVKSLVAEYQ